VTPEFSRTVDADTVSESPRQVQIEADETERHRLEGRFALKAIDRLSADIRLGRRAGIIHAEGRVDADVVQSCVVTDEPLPAHVDAPFHVLFVDDAGARSADDEVELSAEDCDTLPIEGGRIDLGELVAETLALALDPFPRSGGADAALEEAGVTGEEEKGPFAALRALKEQMQKKG
jgi:uncharacterized metal-binding protein YceD (DUF177 family)